MSMVSLINTVFSRIPLHRASPCSGTAVGYDATRDPSRPEDLKCKISDLKLGADPSCGSDPLVQCRTTSEASTAAQTSEASIPTNGKWYLVNRTSYIPPTAPIDEPEASRPEDLKCTISNLRLGADPSCGSDPLVECRPTSEASIPKNFKSYILNFTFLLLLAATLSAQSPTTWSATDGRGRSLPLHAEVGAPRQDRTVGIFYFLWLGAHGYDAHTPTLPDEGVMPVSDTTDYRSPYDISKILAEHPGDPRWGPDKAFHHWGESVFGYYLSDDDWVIAKHAQLLSDADVDVVVFDVTNAVLYLPQALRVCTVWDRLRQRGWDVPQVAFLTNTRHAETTRRLYAGFYAKEFYPDLWFRWKGKPLLMGNPEGLSEEIRNFFTFRQSWAWTEGQEWFGDGKDRWPWLDHTPQQYGWHDDPGSPEQIAVATAEHPVSNIGRSHHDGLQPAPDSVDSGAGRYFDEQWRRALEVDPEFVFVTGWNEWVAMRFTDGRAQRIMGEPVREGDTYFVDQYNPEFSRDIEPMRGGFGDAYYYQLIANVRRYKGAAAAVTDTVTHAISIDGEFTDWDAVRAVYYDHAGDTRHRDHPGWGAAGRYRNTTGRHDLLEARVARTPGGLAFYLRSTPVGSSAFPTLWLDTRPGDTTALGYEYRVVGGADAGSMVLQRIRADGRYTDLDEITVVGNDSGALELQLPLTFLKMAGDALYFKWTDNVDPLADPLRLYTDGDSAPNARFNYVFPLPKSPSQ